MAKDKIKKYVNLILCIVAVVVCIVILVQYALAWFSNNKQTEASGMSFNVSQGDESSNISEIRVNGEEIKGNYYILPGEFYYFEITPDEGDFNTLIVYISSVKYPEKESAFDGMIDEELLKKQFENGTLPTCVNALKFAQVSKKESDVKNSKLWKEAGATEFSSSGSAWQASVTYTLDNGGKVYAMLYFDENIDWIDCLTESVTDSLGDYADRYIYKNSNGFYYQKFNLSFACTTSVQS
jgi:hypothetical protein